MILFVKYIFMRNILLILSLSTFPIIYDGFNRWNKYLFDFLYTCVNTHIEIYLKYEK